MCIFGELGSDILVRTRDAQLHAFIYMYSAFWIHSARVSHVQFFAWKISAGYVSTFCYEDISLTTLSTALAK